MTGARDEGQRGAISAPVARDESQRGAISAPRSRCNETLVTRGVMDWWVGAGSIENKTNTAFNLVEVEVEAELGKS